MLQQLEPHCSCTSILNTETLTNSQDQNCISETPILVEIYSNPWYMLLLHGSSISHKYMITYPIWQGTEVQDK